MTILETTMFTEPLIGITNFVLIVGIVLALWAARMINKGNRELRAKNLALHRLIGDDHKA
jgi:uncharacterized membrane protein